MQGNPNARARYEAYKRNAKKRGLEFDLSFEWFLDIVEQACYLCGAPPSNSYVHDKRLKKLTAAPFVYNGIDRVDNTLPYVSGNLIACCWRCNRSKGNLSVEEFLTHAAKVYEYNFINPIQEDETNEKT